MFAKKVAILKIATLFFLIFFIFLIAWKTGVNLIYFLACFLLCLLTISLLLFLAQFLLGGLHFERSIRNTAFEEDVLNITLSIKNKSPFSKNFLQIGDYFSAGTPNERQKNQLLVSLKGKRSLEVCYSGACFKRGLYKIGPLSVTYSEPLGIFSSTRRYGLYSELLVYPKMFEIRQFPALVKGIVPWFGIDTSRISGDEHEFFGVREYRPGDPIKRIHWPSTARLGSLIVKEFERCAVFKATIIIDLMEEHNIGSGKETTLEYAVKIAASIARYLLEKGSLVQMIAYGEKIQILPFNKGEAHLYDILGLLAAAEAEGSTPMTGVLAEASALITMRSTLILIMPDIEIEALAQAAKLRAKDVSVIPFILLSSTFRSPGKRDEAELMRLKSKQINVLVNLKMKPFFFTQGDNLEEKFRSFVK